MTRFLGSSHFAPISRASHVHFQTDPMPITDVHSIIATWQHKLFRTKFKVQTYRIDILRDFLIENKNSLDNFQSDVSDLLPKRKR